MNWCDEKYVKLYTRDSLTWRSWPWQAKALWPLILRKLDGAGLMETGNLDPAEAVALQTDIPVDVVRVGLAAIIASGTLTQVVGGLIGSSFVEAQEARKTEAQKKRDQRERVRDQRVHAQVTEIRNEAVPTMSPGVPRCPPVSPSSPAQPSPAQPERLPRVADATAPLALTETKPMKSTKTPDPRHAPMRQRLMAAFSALGLGQYAFSGGRDALALTGLLAKGADVEIERRWERALVSTYPTVKTIHELERYWNHFSGSAAPVAARANANRSPVASESVDWSSVTPGEVLL